VVKEFVQGRTCNPNFHKVANMVQLMRCNPFIIERLIIPRIRKKLVSQSRMSSLLGRNEYYVTPTELHKEREVWIQHV